MSAGPSLASPNKPSARSGRPHAVPPLPAAAPHGQGHGRLARRAAAPCGGRRHPQQCREQLQRGGQVAPRVREQWGPGAARARARAAAQRQQRRGALVVAPPAGAGTGAASGPPSADSSRRACAGRVCTCGAPGSQHPALLARSETRGSGLRIARTGTSLIRPSGTSYRHLSHRRSSHALPPACASGLAGLRRATRAPAAAARADAGDAGERERGRAAHGRRRSGRVAARQQRQHAPRVLVAAAQHRRQPRAHQQARLRRAAQVRQVQTKTGRPHPKETPARLVGGNPRETSTRPHTPRRTPAKKTKTQALERQGSARAWSSRSPAAPPAVPARSANGANVAVAAERWPRRQAAASAAHAPSAAAAHTTSAASAAAAPGAAGPLGRPPALQGPQLSGCVGRQRQACLAPVRDARQGGRAGAMLAAACAASPHAPWPFGGAGSAPARHSAQGGRHGGSVSARQAIRSACSEGLQHLHAPPRGRQRGPRTHLQARRRRRPARRPRRPERARA